MSTLASRRSLGTPFAVLRTTVGRGLSCSPRRDRKWERSIFEGVWINDNESGILQDAMDMLERLAPEGPDYRHHRTGEDNGHAHLKNLLMHSQVILPITKGQLDLGPWQTVFYCEFDGQRNKRVIIKMIGE